MSVTGYTTQQSGRWYAVIDARPVGKRTFHRAADEDAARKLLTRLLGQVEMGSYVTPSKTTLSEFALAFLRDAEPLLAPHSWAHYERFLRLHICPAIGMHRLTDLHPRLIQGMLTTLYEKGLSERSVHHAYSILRRVLNKAVQYGDLRENPIKRVDAPPEPQTERVPWTAAQATLFLESVRNDRHYALYYLALKTGKRRGEICGLHWADIDFQQRIITIRHSWTPNPRAGGKNHLRRPKPGHSHTIPMSPATAAVLQQHREKQAAQGKYDPEGFVFLGRTGTPVCPASLDKQFQIRRKRAGLPYVTFHDLRHTMATMLLGQGYDYRTVQELLDHSQASTTLTIYGHTNIENKREAAASLDGLLKE